MRDAIAESGAAIRQFFSYPAPAIRHWRQSAAQPDIRSEQHADWIMTVQIRCWRAKK